MLVTSKIVHICTFSTAFDAILLDTSMLMNKIEAAIGRYLD